eukprot:8284213-Pyramimonas_sp.AAC.1
MQCVRPALKHGRGAVGVVVPSCCARVDTSGGNCSSSLDAIGHNCSISSTCFELFLIGAARGDL